MQVSIEAALAEHQAGRLPQAEAMYWELLRQNPYNASAMHLVGVIALQKQQFTKAVELISKAIALQPNVPEFHHNIGAAYRVLGAFALAEENYRKALSLKPEYAEAYFNLSAVRKFAPDDPIFAPLELQLQEDDWSDADRCFLHFAAGKLYDDSGQHDRAFQHYATGNEARQATFDLQRHRDWIGQIIQATPRQRLQELAAQGLDDQTPVFIVGMPRSGTTLVEQILSSHDEVVGAGELPDISRIAETIVQHVPAGEPYPTYMATVETRVTRGFGEEYLKRLKSLGGGHRRIVDKLPLNFLYLGLIAAMFPRARVIHTQRHPLDTCLSCYFQKFREGHLYSYDLASLGGYYVEYQRLMEHWRQVLPLQMFELQYEHLIDDQQATTRRLIEYLGLPWDDACLEYHRSQRPVTTASNWQVRRPIDRTRRQRWRLYEQHLGPLREALAPVWKE